MSVALLTFALVASAQDASKIVVELVDDQGKPYAAKRVRIADERTMAYQDMENRQRNEWDTSRIGLEVKRVILQIYRPDTKEGKKNQGIFPYPTERSARIRVQVLNENVRSNERPVWEHSAIVFNDPCCHPCWCDPCNPCWCDSCNPCCYPGRGYYPRVMGSYQESSQIEFVNHAAPKSPIIWADKPDVGEQWALWRSVNQRDRNFYSRIEHHRLAPAEAPEPAQQIVRSSAPMISPPLRRFKTAGQNSVATHP